MWEGERGRAHTDQDSTADDGSDASAEAAVEHDGKRFVDDDVGEEQRDKHPVFPLVQEIKNPGRAFPAQLRFVDVILQDLEIDAVLAHKPERASRLAIIKREAPVRDRTRARRDRKDGIQARTQLSNPRRRHPPKQAPWKGCTSSQAPGPRPRAHHPHPHAA